MIACSGKGSVHWWCRPTFRVSTDSECFYFSFVYWCLIILNVCSYMQSFGISCGLVWYGSFICASLFKLLYNWEEKVTLSCKECIKWHFCMFCKKEHWRFKSTLNVFCIFKNNNMQLKSNNTKIKMGEGWPYSIDLERSGAWSKKGWKLLV